MNERLLTAIGGINERFLTECEEYIAMRQSSRKRRKITKVLTICAAAVAAAALLTGAALVIFRVSFPNSFTNRTEYSAAIYDIEPFSMSISLPSGCRIVRSGEAGGWSPMDIMMNGEKVGTADYNIFELYDGVERSDPNFYRMVYNQLMLSAQANWDNGYTVVKQDDVSENAVTRIGIVPGFGNGMADNAITYLPGILAFNTDLLVYVNISFDAGVFTDEQIEAVARSIVLSR